VADPDTTGLAPPDPGVLSQIKAALLGHSAILNSPSGLSDLLREAAQPAPGWGYGSVLPVAYRGGESDTNPGGPLQLRLGMPGIARDMLNGVADLFQGPATGTVTPQATNTLAMLAGGDLAKPYDPNVLRTFLGENSPGAAGYDFDAASRMEAQGVAPRDIHQATGLSRDTTGKGPWRYEVPDQGARFTMAQLQNPTAQQTLGDVLDHPALYAADPRMANIQVQGLSPMQSVGYKGYYENPQISGTPVGRISMASAPPDAFMGTLLHETQHGAQELHDLGRGGNPSQFISPEEKSIIDSTNQQQTDLHTRMTAAGIDPYEAQRALRLFPGGEPAPALKFYDPATQQSVAKTYQAAQDQGFGQELSDLADRQRLVKAIGDNAHQEYLNIPGEQEARITQVSQGMTAGQRALSFPADRLPSDSGAPIQLNRAALGDPQGRAHIKDLISQGFRPGQHTASQLQYLPQAGAP
jgi:hypothetical protein